MKDVLKFNVSSFEKINYVRYRGNYDTCTLEEVTRRIQQGNEYVRNLSGNYVTLRDLTWKLRNEYPYEDLQRNKFNLLPAIAYNGCFKLSDDGKSMQLVRYNQVTTMDFDHIASQKELEAKKAWLKTIPFVIQVYVSASGMGLKAVVLHDNTDPEKHKDMYLQLLEYFGIQNPDTSCSDLNRRQYLVHDPDIWTTSNPNPEPYHYVPRMHEEKVFSGMVSEQPRHQFILQQGQQGNAGSRKISDESILTILNSIWRKQHPEYWKVGFRANAIFQCSSYLCRLGVDYDKALQFFKDNWEESELPVKEILYHAQRGYDNSEMYNSVPWQTSGHKN